MAALDAYRAAADHHHSVLFGSCGWTTDPLDKGHNFFPSSVRTAVDRLRHYSRFLPQVEIDTSNYAIPRQAQLREWCSVVPAGFVFHIKAFGLFPAQSCDPGALPRYLRAQYLSPAQEAQPRITLGDLPQELVDALWLQFNSAVQVLADAGKLGCVVFQFHANFGPSVKHMQHVAWCRSKLAPHFPMAVEFRQRAWYDDRQVDPAAAGGLAVLSEEGYLRVEQVQAQLAAALEQAKQAAAAAGGGGGGGASTTMEDASQGEEGDQALGHSHGALHGDDDDAAEAASASSLGSAPSSQQAVAPPASASSSATSSSSSADPPFSPSTSLLLFPSQKASTLYFLRRLRLINVAADDLAEEYSPRDASGQPLEPDGSGRLAIDDDVTHPDVAYIRLHRRRGGDRLMPPGVVRDWVARCNRWASTLTSDAVGGSSISAPSASCSAFRFITDHDTALRPVVLRGPICFNVSAAYADHSLLNIRALASSLKEEFDMGTNAAQSASASSSSSSAYSAADANTITCVAPFTTTSLVNALAAPALCASASALSLTSSSSAASLASFRRYALPLDWRDRARAADAKTGIGAYFHKKAAEDSAPKEAPLSGKKRPLPDDEAEEDAVASSRKGTTPSKRDTAASVTSSSSSTAASHASSKGKMSQQSTTLFSFFPKR